MNALSEHKKYIAAMIAGALVTIIAGFLVFVIFKNNKNYDDSKSEILSFTYEIMTDKVSQCQKDLDMCKNSKDNMIVLDSLNTELVAKVNYLKKENSRLTRLIYNK